MQTIYLPFNGTNSGFNDPKPRVADFRTAKTLLSLEEGAAARRLTALVGVRFDVPNGNGVVSLLIPTLSGEVIEKEFAQDGATQMIGVPIAPLGVSLYHISKRAKGDVIVCLYES